MSNTLRRLVLNNYKALHRTRLKVFQGDERALAAGRQKIYEEFSKNKHVTDQESVKALLQVGVDAERILRTQVVQAAQQRPGVFKARITEDTLRLDNVMYDDSKIPEGGVRRGRGAGGAGPAGGCCQQDK